MGRSIRRAERSISKTYLPYDPDQQLLLPAALQEWLPENHLAYFISDVEDHVGPLGHHRPLRGGKVGRPALTIPG